MQKKRGRPHSSRGSYASAWRQRGKGEREGGKEHRRKREGREKEEGRERALKEEKGER
eukprot:gene4666-6488_t